MLDTRSHAERRLFGLFFCFLFVIAVALSLFGSLLPFPSGGFSIQRSFLCVLIVLLGVLGAWAFLTTPGFIEENLWPLTMVLSIGGLIFAHAFISNSHFRWIEPGLYVGFLGCIVLFGGLLGKSLSLKSLLEPMSVILGACVALYGAMSLNYYGFSLSDRDVKIADHLPWGFVNIRYWSQVATWLLPLLPLALINGLARRSRLWVLLVVLGGAIWIWMILLSSARGTVVSLLVGTVCAFVIFRHAVLPWLKLFGLLLLCGGIFWLVLSGLMPALLGVSFEGRELSIGSSGRWVLWQEAFAMSLQSFPFGQGPQAWLTHEPLTEAYRGSKAFGHPHNMYLMWAAEYGWLVVCLIFGMFAWMAHRLFKLRNLMGVNARSRDEVVLCGVTVSVASALCHASISAVFVAPASMLIGLFVLIVFYAMLQSPQSALNKGRSSMVRRYPAWTFCCLFIVSAMSLWWLSGVYQYHQAMVRDLPVYLEQPANAYFPRFWYHGYFPRTDTP